MKDGYAVRNQAFELLLKGFFAKRGKCIMGMIITINDKISVKIKKKVKNY